MTTQEITQALSSNAEYHLNTARKGGLLIGQTKLGTLNLTYENKVYTLT